MTDKFLNKRPLYPLISIGAVILIMVFGLISAKSAYCIWFLAAMWVIFLVFGYWRSCLAVIPAAAVLCLMMAGITFLISHDPSAAMAAVNRILSVCIAVIPGLALEPITLVRGLSALRLPRMLTLGMMITLDFFPLLKGEVRQVREAMKTRGAGSFFNPKIFYRAFLIPLIVRLVNISDTLSLSVETRGFTTLKDAQYSVYKAVKVKPADLVFLALVIAGCVLVVIL